jgi:hypothetical protein
MLRILIAFKIHCSRPGLNPLTLGSIVYETGLWMELV